MPIDFKDFGQFILVEKPSGMHSTGAQDSVESELLRLDSELKLLQRLDFETSGLMLAARGETAFTALLSQQKRGGLVKYYRALTEPIDWQDRTEAVWIWSRYRHSKKVQVSATQESKRAQISQTTFSCRERYPNFSLVEAKLAKGLRHQVRAHLAYLGAPLVGDTLYGSDRMFPVSAQAPAFILHACRLEFECPFERGKVHRFSCEDPGYLKVLLVGTGV
jgi:23S rRNA-/tRNA-specific pseudouridylate synthase